MLDEIVPGHLNPRSMVAAQKIIASQNGCVTLDGNVTNISRYVITDDQSVTNKTDNSGYHQIHISKLIYDILLFEKTYNARSSSKMFESFNSCFNLERLFIGILILRKTNPARGLPLP